MKLFSTIAVAVLSLGLFAVQVPASAASKNGNARTSTHQVAGKKNVSAPARAAGNAQKRASAFFKRVANSPREFFQKRPPAAGPVRARNDGVPPEAYMNVPRPVVSEGSIF